MKKNIWFIIFMICAGFVFGGKVATLTEIKRPNSVIVDAERLYVVERTTIFIYSLKDYKLLVKFGKQGEGPQEFRTRPNGTVRIYPLDDYIYIDSIGRVSVFTKDGKFVKEKPVLTGQRFQPLGHDQFVGYGTITIDNTNFFTINLYDSNVKRVKELFRQLNMNQPNEIRIFFTTLSFETYKNKVFLCGREDFIIDTFDKTGKKVFTIKRDLKRHKVTEQDKKNVLDWYKQDPRYDEAQVQILGQMLRFPDSFRAIDSIRAKDDKLYVLTHNIKNDKNEFLIFDINGKYLETKYFHLEKGDPIYPYPYDIGNGNIYQLIEDLDAEEWNLHVIKFD